MINAIRERVAFDFGMNGKRSVMLVVTKLHTRSVEASFALYKIANSGIFNNHFRPEWITGKTKEKIAVGSSGFYDDIGPAS